MSNFKSKMLAVALAATTVLSSAVPSVALAAESVESDASAAATTEAAAEVEPEEKAAEEPVVEVVEGKEDEADNGGSDASSGKTTTEEAPADEGKTPASEKSDDAGNTGAPKTGETEATTDDQQSDQETKEENNTEKKHRFRIDFVGAGTVKVIFASDEGAGKNDPSATIIKNEDGNTDKKFRTASVEALAVKENDTDLTFELNEGEKIEVITESAEGFKVSEYRVTTDSGAEVEADPASWEYTLNENTALKITIEKDSEKAQTGSVAVKVSSAGGTVTVTNGETSYTIMRTRDGSVTVTDQDGNAVSSEGDFDLVVEDEIGKNISVKAAAEEGAHVTAFSVTGEADNEPSAFKAEDKADEFAQEIEIADGQKIVSISFEEMPEFTAEQTAGKYVVKIHAAAGILLAGTTVDVKEMSDAESRPYVQKAEKMADTSVAEAVIDIRFLDMNGMEIQPKGAVEVTFVNAAEDDASMSVYHAVDRSADKMEAVPATTEGSDVKITSSSFSPFVLLASFDEPDWTKGGSGSKTDVSDKIKAQHKDEYKYYYKDYGFDNSNDDYPGMTFCFGIYVNDKRVGWSYCIDPLENGYGVNGTWANKVYEVSAPMFVKALYYGVSGKTDLSVIKNATGVTSYGGLNIITHVAAAEIYARLNYSSKTSPGDAFLAANNKLKNAVYNYVRAIEDLPTPEGYYGYVTDNGSGKQDFGFGCFPLTEGPVQVKKVSSAPAMTNDNPLYSLEGAKYWVYTSEAAARAKGNAGWMGAGSTMITNSEGVSNTVELEPGTYWLIEGAAPKGFKLNTEPVRFDVTIGNTTTVTVSDVAANDPVSVVIDKKCKDATEGKIINSLNGTEFTLKYYDGYYDASTLPGSATRTWVLSTIKSTSGKYYAQLIPDCLVSGSDAFYLAGDEPTLPLGTITIEETKAAEGYLNDGTFGDANMYIGHIVPDETSESGGRLSDVQGKRKTTNSYEVTDTPTPPSIVKTTATDTLTDSHSAYPGSVVTIKDDVVYEGLIVGMKYTLKGELLDRNTGRVIKDANGDTVTAEKEFICESIDGTVTIEFTFPADSAFRGKTTVVGETLINEYGDTLVHADITDEAQTIRFPKIGTTAVGSETSDHIIPAGEDASIEDRVSYENLVVGQQYTLKGVVMDKATGEPLLVNDKEVRAEKNFTAEGNSGEEIVTFTFDSSDLAGKKLVIYEELFVGDHIVADHKDIKDLGQTVSVPDVKTYAEDKATRTKNQFPDKSQVIVDKVSYTGLIAGKIYEISGDVKIKDEDVDSFDNAETVPFRIVGATGNGQISFDDEKVTFVPAGTDGEMVNGDVYVSFQVDASDLAGEQVVVGETIRYKGKEIAVHRDISDTDQNIIYPDGKTTAIDKETGIKNALAAENRVFKDTFEYENLLPGETYRFTGKVMVTMLDEDGSPVVDEDGKTVVEEIPSVMTDENGTIIPNGYVEFIPEGEEGAQAAAGNLELYFSIDASELANKDVTVYENVTLNGEPVIVHEVLDGSQTVYIPEGQTTAIDSETQDQVAFPDEEVSIIDTFCFKNLIPGTEYTLDGRVMLKDTGEEIESALTDAEFVQADGADTTGSISVADNVVTFTPDQKDGTVKLTFVVDGSDLAGEDTVIFERAYHNGKEVIIHENIDDEKQTIHYPDGHTQAADPDTDDRTMMAKGEVLIRDRVFYENVLPGREYVLTGQVMLKPLGDEEPEELEARMVDADGNDIDEWVFTAEEKDGVEDVCFMINADDLAGRSVVMYEDMKFVNPEARTTIFKHEDIDDEEQTIHFPDGRTTALDSDTGSHTSFADEKVTIIDEVKFINLIPGKMYTVDGVLYDKKTGKPVIVDGHELTAHKEFVPEAADGSIFIEFTFTGVSLAGKSVVAEETVESNGKEVFVHADINDEEQTVDFPDVHTSVADKKDGDREISYNGTVNIIDTVSYENLTIGTRYHVTGVLIYKKTGVAAKAGDKEITGEVFFTATSKDGTVTVPFTFKADDLQEGDYVVFEDVYEVNAQTGDEKIVGSHKDINDDSQTIRRPPAPNNKVQTGDNKNPALWLALFGAASAGIVGIILHRKKTMNK